MELSLNRFHDFAVAGIALVTKDDWKHYCHHVKLIEEACYEKDSIISDVIDRIIITNPNEDDSGDEEDKMSSGDTNSYSSDSEVAYSLD
jgi:hypothetical protein